MSKRTVIVLIVVLALGIVTYLVWPSPEITPAGDFEASVSDTEAAGDIEQLLEGFDEPELIDPPAFTRRSRTLGDTRTNQIREVVAAQEPFPHDVAMDEYKQEVWADIQANPPELRQPGDPEVDAELAYRLYMFYGNCSVAPRTEHHVDQQLAKITRRAQHANEATLKHLENNANQFLDFYELCLQIPPEVDCREEAVNWMSEAVRLGHEIAEVQFYDKAMGFILRADRFSGAPPLVMLHPGLIEEFKATARYALKKALDKGHPEAFVAMADAVDDGIIFPKDPVLALAYLRVAEMQAAQTQLILDRVDYYKSQALAVLDPAQVADAEQLALELRTKIGS